MIALLEAKRAGLYARQFWLPNIVAGVIVGVIALPLAMAFAIASGARPEQGLYTAIIGGVLVTLLGGSRLQIAGPTGAFIAIPAGITAKYGVAGLQVATLMAGVILLVMGLARMGGVKRVPGPLTAMVTATVLQSVLQLPGVATIGSAFGGIPQGLPSFRLPDISLP